MSSCPPPCLNPVKSPLLFLNLMFVLYCNLSRFVAPLALVLLCCWLFWQVAASFLIIFSRSWIRLRLGLLHRHSSHRCSNAHLYLSAASSYLLISLFQYLFMQRLFMQMLHLSSYQQSIANSAVRGDRMLTTDSIQVGWKAWVSWLLHWHEMLLGINHRFANYHQRKVLDQRSFSWHEEY